MKTKKISLEDTTLIILGENKYNFLVAGKQCNSVDSAQRHAASQYNNGKGFTNIQIYFSHNFNGDRNKMTSWKDAIMWKPVYDK